MRMLVGEMLPLLAMAFVIVGLPALILKLTAIWFVRSEGDKPRLRLLALSVGGSALAGIVTILIYSILSRLYEFPAPDALYAPQSLVMIAAAAILIILVATVELVLWRDFTQKNGAQAAQSDAAWLIASNVWILWAIWLMDQYREIQQLSGLD
jgi:uncharacterized membrane protein